MNTGGGACLNIITLLHTATSSVVVGVANRVCGPHLQRSRGCLPLLMASGKVSGRHQCPESQGHLSGDPLMSKAGNALIPFYQYCTGRCFADPPKRPKILQFEMSVVLS